MFILYYNSCEGHTVVSRDRSPPFLVLQYVLVSTYRRVLLHTGGSLVGRRDFLLLSSRPSSPLTTMEAFDGSTVPRNDKQQETSYRNRS